MTYAEALDLLELNAADAADIQRIRDAYARRRQQLQSQLKAAAAEPLRAAYQETLAAVDMAAAMLQTRAASPGGNQTDGSKAGVGKPGMPRVKPPGTAAAREPDWISATPWQNIGAAQEEHPPTGEQRAPRPATPAAASRPSPAATKGPIKRAEGTITLRLPQEALEAATPEMRPVATRLGTVTAPLPPPPEEMPGHSRWGAYAALLLLFGGLAGGAGWAWNEGLLDWLTAGGATDVGGRHSSAATGPAPESDVSALLEEQRRQLSTLRQEIEKLAVELTEQTEELGGGAVLDWREQMAAADREEDSGEIDAAGQRLARLHDNLKAQTEAAGRVLMSRQRLGNAGPLQGSSPLAKAAQAHIQALERQAEVSVAESNLTVAAQKYDKALEARTRLAGDIEVIEPARARAAAEHARAVKAMEALDAGEEAQRRFGGNEAGVELLSGTGAVVASWLAGERAASELVSECEQLEESMGVVADRLGTIGELEALTAASLKELSAIRQELGESVPAEPLARLLPATDEIERNRRAGQGALSAGRLEDAVQAHDAAAADASEALEKGTAVRDLLMRRAQVAARLQEAAGAIAAGFERLDALIAQKAEGAAEGSSWPQAAARLASDRALLRDLSAPLGAFPQDPSSLELAVRQAELRAQAFETLANAVEELAEAEYRLLLLMELSAGANVYVAGDAQVPLPAAAEARASVVGLSRNQAIAPEEAEAARRSLASVTEQTNVAAEQLVSTATSQLSEMLRSSQERYREEFGQVDLREVWQPAPLPADVTPAPELAERVSEALAAGADEGVLRRELTAGDAARAEAILRHVRDLAAAEATLSALRKAAEAEDDAGMRQLHHSAAAGETAEVRSLLALRVEAARVTRAAARHSESRWGLGTWKS